MKKILLRNWKIVLYCFIISFLFLAICSKSSFLYPFNDWADANCFFTMGKGMFHGKVLYADLFDQKGPLIFLYYGIASLISYKTFVGVFIIEVISFSIFLYYAHKLMTLYVKKEISYLSLPIISFIILTLPAFTHGGSVEEFTLPMLMYSLYSLTRFLKEGKISYSFIFLNGLMAGLVGTMKFSILGFWFIFIIIVFFYFILKKSYKKAFMSSVIFLCGMIIPFIPWIIYFSMNNAIKDWINSYIVFNIKFYPSKVPFILKMGMFILKPLRFMVVNLGYGIFLMLGFGSLIFTNTFFKNKNYGMLIILSYIFLCLGIFCGGISFRYYYLVLTPFMIYGIIELGLLIQNRYHINLNSVKKPLSLMTISFFLIFSYIGNKNVTYMSIYFPKEKLVQYKFSKIINEKENPKILNYGYLDGGFYTMTGVIPANKYFQKQNVSNDIFPYIMDEQNELIRSKKIDFVITRKIMGKKDKQKYSPYLAINYSPIAFQNQYYEEHKYTYTLWSKNPEK